MFSKSKKTEEHEAALTKIEELERELELAKANHEAEIRRVLEAESKAVAETVAISDDYERAQNEISRLSRELSRLEDKLMTGNYIMEGESLPVKDVVLVLREELECTHAELKALQEAVKACQTLLGPHLG